MFISSWNYPSSILWMIGRLPYMIQLVIGRNFECVKVSNSISLTHFLMKQMVRTYQQCNNPFVANAPFLYSLKTPENLTVFWSFQGVEKGCIGNKWVNSSPFIIRAFFIKRRTQFLYSVNAYFFSALFFTTKTTYFQNHARYRINLSVPRELWWFFPQIK